MKDIVKRITDPGERAKQVCEFFHLPMELVLCLFKHSKEYFEGMWKPFEDSKTQDDYYSAGFYTIRQMSYTFPNRGETFSGAIHERLEKWKGSLLDFGCGVGDYLIAYALKGNNCHAVEHRGVPIEFLKYRVKKYGVEDRVQIHERVSNVSGKVNNTFLLSALDHVENPELYATVISNMTKGEIYATPCIDETYDRPTHEKHILRKVPDAFKIIEEHNKKVLSANIA
jgi:cyclopropane fatty-acyl-phospholipid synthase-like methyltransferase